MDGQMLGHRDKLLKYNIEKLYWKINRKLIEIRKKRKVKK